MNFNRNLKSYCKSNIEIFALFILAAVFFANEISLLQTDSFWNSYSFPYSKTFPILAVLSVFYVTQALVASTSILRLLIPVTTWLLFLFFVAIDKTEIIFFCFFLWVNWVVVKGFSGSLKHFFNMNLSPPISYLIFQVILQFYYLVLALIGHLTIELVYLPIFLFGSYGVLLTFYNARDEKLSASIRKLAGIDSNSSSIIFFSIIIFSLVFISGSIPQTYTDGLVYRLPFLKDLLETGTMPNHLYLWARLIPQSVVFQMVPGYFAFGEIGAVWTVFIFLITLFLVVLEFCEELEISRALGYFTAFLVISHPVIWLLSTVVYNDIPIVCYSVAGLLSLLKFRGNSKGLDLLLALTLLAFACTIKLNVPIFILVTLITWIFLDPTMAKLLLRVKNVWAFGLALFVLLPWYIWTFSETGNPFFPFLGKYFRSKFPADTIFTDEANSMFAAFDSFIEYILIPWSLTFNTSRFGTYPNGSFGPILLFLTPLLIFSILRLFNRGLIFSPEYRIRLILVFAPLLTFLGVGSVIGLLYFRYSLAAFVTFIVGAVALIDKQKFKKVKELYTQLACLSLILFLVLVGARSNYGVTGGIGDEIFSGEVSEYEFKNRLTHGVDDFLNEVLQKDENVISYIFFPINRIRNDVYFVSTKTSLFGQVRDPESFRVFTTKHNIKYAIVNNSNIPEFLNTAGFFDQVFLDEGLVYGSGNYAIYDLRHEGQGRWLKHHLLESGLKEKVEVSAKPDEWFVREFPIDKQVELVRGKVKVVTNEEKSSLLVNLVEYDINDRELRQVIPAKELLRKVEDELKFVFKPLDNTTKVKIIVHPWRAVDGKIIVLGGEFYVKMSQDK